MGLMEIPELSTLEVEEGELGREGSLCWTGVIISTAADGLRDREKNPELECDDDLESEACCAAAIFCFEITNLGSIGPLVDRLGDEIWILWIGLPLLKFGVKEFEAALMDLPPGAEYGMLDESDPYEVTEDIDGWRIGRALAYSSLYDMRSSVGSSDGSME